MGIIWAIIIGCMAGVIAKFVMPGDNEPSGFILTTIPGIVGAFVASCPGQSLGWYGPGEGAGVTGAGSAKCCLTDAKRLLHPDRPCLQRAAQLDGEADKGPIWFFTSTGAAIVQGLNSEDLAIFTFVSKGHDVFATVHGHMTRATPNWHFCASIPRVPGFGAMGPACSRV